MSPVKDAFAMLDRAPSAGPAVLPAPSAELVKDYRQRYRLSASDAKKQIRFDRILAQLESGKVDLLAKDKQTQLDRRWFMQRLGDLPDPIQWPNAAHWPDPQLAKLKPAIRRAEQALIKTLAAMRPGARRRALDLCLSGLERSREPYRILRIARAADAWPARVLELTFRRGEPKDIEAVLPHYPEITARALSMARHNIHFKHSHEGEQALLDYVRRSGVTGNEVDDFRSCTLGTLLSEHFLRYQVAPYARTLLDILLPRGFDLNAVPAAMPHIHLGPRTLLEAAATAQTQTADQLLPLLLKRGADPAVAKAATHPVQRSFFEANLLRKVAADPQHFAACRQRLAPLGEEARAVVAAVEKAHRARSATRRRAQVKAAAHR